MNLDDEFSVHTPGKAVDIVVAADVSEAIGWESFSYRRVYDDHIESFLNDYIKPVVQKVQQQLKEEHGIT